ncbi:Uncharacterized protein PBTT_10153 [Plasmodiophora brassicae]|uniref:Uncharacterized protein n=1 Tax=Plasmodiophora brassicae TaxID=37360 RepID=A0A0G4INY0_PLABS|nr:hypothetical protein PBRA_005486 [Plasmodiophora brassicae]SPR01839.1 unnamed protein product [Plasmodiophora brassicae]
MTTVDELREIRDLLADEPTSAAAPRLADRSVPTSKAVLSALKALHDRIGELEQERAAQEQAVQEAARQVCLAQDELDRQRQDFDQRIRVVEEERDDARASVLVAEHKIDALIAELKLVKSLSRSSAQQQQHLQQQQQQQSTPSSPPAPTPAPIVIPTGGHETDLQATIRSLLKVNERLTAERDEAVANAARVTSSSSQTNGRPSTGGADRRPRKKGTATKRVTNEPTLVTKPTISSAMKTNRKGSIKKAPGRGSARAVPNAGRIGQKLAWIEDRLNRIERQSRRQPPPDCR